MAVRITRACALARATSQHLTLQEMQLWGNRFDSAACREWRAGLQYLNIDIAVQDVDNTYHCVDDRSGTMSSTIFHSR